MTDKEKLTKVIAEIKRLHNQSLEDENRQADRGLESAANVSYGKSMACKVLISFIDSLPEEPVSEDLEKAAKHYLYSNILYDDVYVGNPTDKDCIEMFKAGAQWQKEQMMKQTENLSHAERIKAIKRIRSGL